MCDICGATMQSRNVIFDEVATGKYIKIIFFILGISVAHKTASAEGRS
jgi:hypothetical protein